MTEYKKIIPYINAENELESSTLKKAAVYDRNGADELFIYNYSVIPQEQEEFLGILKAVVKQVDIPVIAGCYITRFEDIKKAFYTGASKLVISYAKLENKSVIKEGALRFGSDKLIIELDASEEKDDGFLKGKELIEEIMEFGAAGILLKHLYVSQGILDKIAHLPLPVYVRDSLLRNDMETLLGSDNVVAVATNYYENKDILSIKRKLHDSGIHTNIYESNITFSELKKNEQGLVPVIIQDYKTNEILQLAYMNEVAYNSTIATGKMTYYSRSRNTLWVKGETSGHYQYLKSMSVDCDADTLLAKVKQIGAACHTGNYSCFYRDLIKKEYDDTNPLTIFEDVFHTILNRKENPKEGSYTNYLFDKGLDKILKKCGEEAAEIIIAAKNQESGELKYEIADFLYHMMVLMADCGLTWEDIVKELAHRR